MTALKGRLIKIDTNYRKVLAHSLAAVRLYMQTE